LQCRVGGVDISLNLFSLLLAWGITEVIRYAFYASKELVRTPYAITWLRYTTFIVLYPMGVSSELAMVSLALPLIREIKLWSCPMPNVLNMAFDYSVFCILVSACYAPGAARGCGVLLPSILKCPILQGEVCTIAFESQLAVAA
jgi:very-long-chain (3R)-3-hydroxyacyl-CoA dehydratase